MSSARGLPDGSSAAREPAAVVNVADDNPFEIPEGGVRIVRVHRGLEYANKDGDNTTVYGSMLKLENCCRDKNIYLYTGNRDLVDVMIGHYYGDLARVGNLADLAPTGAFGVAKLEGHSYALFFEIFTEHNVRYVLRDSAVSQDMSAYVVMTSCFPSEQDPAANFCLTYPLKNVKNILCGGVTYSGGSCGVSKKRKNCEYEQSYGSCCLNHSFLAKGERQAVLCQLVNMTGRVFPSTVPLSRLLASTTRDYLVARHEAHLSVGQWYTLCDPKGPVGPEKAFCVKQGQLVVLFGLPCANPNNCDGKLHSTSWDFSRVGALDMSQWDVDIEHV